MISNMPLFSIDILKYISRNKVGRFKGSGWRRTNNMSYIISRAENSQVILESYCGVSWCVVVSTHCCGWEYPPYPPPIDL